MATTEEAVLSANMVRALPGGRTLVNDPTGRKVVLLDADLRVVKVVADTTPATGNAYAGRFGGLIPFRGDSTLFVDPQSLSMLVIDPQGNLGRTMSVPNPREAAFIAGAVQPTGYDPRGRLVYRGMSVPTPDARGGPSGPPQNGQNFTMPPMPDTAPLVRVALANRAVDTASFLKVPRAQMQATMVDGRMVISSKVNPVPVVDDWAVLPSGDVAVLRGRDYRMELHRVDGTVLSGPKLPFPWRRLTDEDKVAFLDSVKAARARMPAPAAAPTMATAVTGGSAVASAGPPGGGAPVTMGGGGVSMVIMSGPPPGAGGGSSGDGPRSPPMQIGTPQVTFVEPSELPDYLPPFAANSTRADPLGRVWVRLALPTPTGTGPLYDIIDGSTGQLVDHVQLPAGRVLVGFAQDGTPVLQSRTDGGALRLERVALK
jgi:hypothetical protein